ncbi:MAG: hypothetical protein KBD05_01120 [Candidatus Pacebacteria bacterium]|nr:hypothetical protein [Candidatus Paceibacterota bacterium]
MIEALGQNPDKYQGRFIVVEIGPGGKHRSLLKDLSLPEEQEPLYLAVDPEGENLDIHQKKNSPSPAVMKASITDPAFYHDRDLDGQVDRVFVFNVLSIAGTSSLPHFKRLFSEKIRSILKRGGKAYVAEWLTPGTMQEILDFKYEDYGLEARIVRDSEEVKKILKEEGISKNRRKSIAASFDSLEPQVTPFLLVLTKKE